MLVLKVHFIKLRLNVSQQILIKADCVLQCTMVSSPLPDYKFNLFYNFSYIFFSSSYFSFSFYAAVERSGFCGKS